MFWKLYILYGVVTLLNKVAGVFIQPVARAVVALGHILVSGAMEFQTCDISAFTCSDWASMLTDNPSMKLVGAGGNGEVYAPSPPFKGNNNYFIKRTASSNDRGIRNECAILKYLQAFNIPHLESCLSNCNTKEDSSFIVLSPFFHATNQTPVSDFNLISDENRRLQTMKEFLETNLMILAANVVVSDLQYLIDRETGTTV